MKFKIILFFVLGFFLFSSLTYSHPPRRVKWDDDATDTTRKNNPDSVKEARAHIMDSVRDAHARTADSAKMARKHTTDSIQSVRKHITDSTATVRKYRDSKHYKDSVAHSRVAKTNALKESRQAHMDSLTNARKKLTDSLTASRKSKTDSIKTIQKRRSDSIATVRKYKASKRYTDSVAIVKHERMDSIKNAQEAFRTKMAKARKHSLDSATAVRKHSMDSIKTVRSKFMDSIKIVRKKRTDSLAKVKADKEKIAKANQKKKEDALKFKMELKIKQKHEAWTNKTMLKKRWSPMRRVAQNSFTHYNYYYNANKKMDEALTNMQRSRKENYDSLIGLYPFDPNRDSTLLSADMDSIVRKVSVGIQIHDPRIKWSNDLYLLLGEAYYYRGKYDNASIAFRYIISTDEEKKKEEAKKNGNYRSKDAPSILEDENKSTFLKHKSVHNEAILWLARTFTEAGQVENAESVLSLLESDAKLPDDLVGRLATEKAFAYLQDKNYPAAATELATTEDDDNIPGWVRMRAAFIHGQLLQRMEQYADAANSFEKVLGYYPKIEMDFYARKYTAYNRLLAGQDIDDVTRPLKRVINDAKYVSYYDQVYYVLGTLAAKANETDDAITYFTKSTTTPKATKKQKAISFAALGDVYYATASYSNAKNAYDSAAKYSSAAGKDNAVASAIQRNKGLEDITGPKKVIHDQDSLMDLARMNRREQQAVVRRYLRYLEQQQQDSITNAENSGVTAVTAEQATDQQDAGATNWYFANPTLMQQGSTDFKRKWGNRPLTDNWRRAAGISSSASNGDEEEADAGAPTKGGPTEESLMARIPNTPQQKELSVKVETRAYLLLAKGYVKLENYPEAIHALDTLDMRFPNHNLKEDVLYMRYQIAIKQNKLADAQKYAEQLLAKFPKSEHANELRPKHSESKVVTTGKTVAAYYEETYGLLLQHQYTEALMHVNIAQQQYDNPVFKKRFQIVEAMAYAGSGDYDKADTLLKKFLVTNPPPDTLATWAKNIQQYVKEVRNGGKPSWYNDTIPAAQNTLAKNNTKNAVHEPPKSVAPPPPPAPVVPAMYSYHADSPHYCIVVIPGVDSRTSALKQHIKEFSKSSYDTLNLGFVIDLYNIDQGVMVIKQFPNAKVAKLYMSDLLASQLFNDFKPGEITILTISSENYRKMYADKTATPYLGFFNANYKAN